MCLTAEVEKNTFSVITAASEKTATKKMSCQGHLRIFVWILFYFFKKRVGFSDTESAEMRVNSGGEASSCSQMSSNVGIKGKKKIKKNSEKWIQSGLAEGIKENTTILTPWTDQVNTPTEEKNFPPELIFPQINTRWAGIFRGGSVLVFGTEWAVASTLTEVGSHNKTLILLIPTLKILIGIKTGTFSS